MGPFMNSQQALPLSMRPATSQWNEASVIPGGGLDAGGFQPSIAAMRAEENLFHSVQPVLRSQSLSKTDALMRGGNHRDKSGA